MSAVGPLSFFPAPVPFLFFFSFAAFLLLKHKPSVACNLSVAC